MKGQSEKISASLFMVIGAVIGAAIMAMLVPETARSYLELKVGLVAGGFGGFAIHELVQFFIKRNKNSKRRQ